jgi:uncharacterized protein (TIGR02466 family)
MIEITTFSTHAYIGNLDISGLVEIVQRYHDSNITKIQYSNRGGWQSPAMSVGDCEEFDQIISQVQQYLTPIYQEYGVGHTPMLSNYWFNINQQHSYNLSHTHPGSVFSTVLYLQVPEHSGNLILQRSDNQQAYVIANHSTPKNQTSFTIEPTEGMLIAFPSHVPHYVEQNESNQQRISVAFNFK